MTIRTAFDASMPTDSCTAATAADQTRTHERLRPVQATTLPSIPTPLSVPMPDERNR